MFCNELILYEFIHFFYFLNCLAVFVGAASVTLKCCLRETWRTYSISLKIVMGQESKAQVSLVSVPTENSGPLSLAINASLYRGTYIHCLL